jgi:predicted aspartyl protease
MRKNNYVFLTVLLGISGLIQSTAYAQYVNGLPNHFINGSSDQYITVSPNLSVATDVDRMPSGRRRDEHKPTISTEMMPKDWRPGMSGDSPLKGDQAIQQDGKAQEHSSVCQLKKEITLPMTEMAGHYMISVLINDHPANMMVDTGSEKTLLNAASADAWNLPEDSSRAYLVHGVGGEAHSLYPRIVSSLKFGSAEWTRFPVHVTSSLGGEQQMQRDALDGILGADILSRFDTEFDFPARTMTLYTAMGCLGHFVPWTGKYQSFSTNQDRENRFVLGLGLNGHATAALVDTGASQSLVSAKAAQMAGVGMTELANDPHSSGTGMDNAPVHTYIHRFLMQISDSRYNGAPLHVADVELKNEDMLLGMDFFKNRRLWVSYSTGWVFMQIATPDAHNQHAANVSLTRSRGTPNPTLFHR